MKSSSDAVWETEPARQLARVVTAIDEERTMQNFLRDVMTEQEIITLSSRLEAARMLQENKEYNEIIEKTKLSSRTVARVSGWTQNGNSGYEAALKLVGTHHAHMSPASAE